MFDKLAKNKNKIYWICQFTGWGLYSLFYFLININYQGYDSRKIFVYFYIGFLGISFTHLYRIIIKKRKWIELTLKKLIPRVLAFNILSSILIVFSIFAVILLTKLYTFDQLGFGLVLVNVANLSVVILLWSFIYFAIHYFENYKHSEIERLIWEAAVKDFEIKTLKSQLNPHFMFNALNSIRALIEENPEKAKNAITRLSNIFRYSLRIERIETVTLEEELKTVEDYLQLEQIRFEERLKFNFDISPQSNLIEIPPMMIQTLVENGIKHGISKIPEGGEINISAKVNNSALTICIYNTGNLDNDLLLNSKGFGLSNTKQRLNILYGENATFNLFNENNFVKAEIIIPKGGI